MSTLFELRIDVSSYSVRTLERFRAAVEKVSERFFTKKGISVIGYAEGVVDREGEFKDRAWRKRRRRVSGRKLK